MLMMSLLLSGILILLIPCPPWQIKSHCLPFALNNTKKKRLHKGVLIILYIDIHVKVITVQ